jgi:hypothetical protein
VLLVLGFLVILELDTNLFYNSLRVHLCCKKHVVYEIVSEDMKGKQGHIGSFDNKL